MNLNKQHLAQLLISFCVALSVFVLIQNTLQFTAQRVELSGYFPNPTQVTISNVSTSGHIETLDEFEISASQDLQRVGTDYINRHIHRLQIEFQHRGDELITLSRIKIPFPYIEDYYFNQDNVSKYFSSAQSSAENARQYRGEHIVLRSNEQVARPTYLSAALISGLFFFGVWVLLRNIRWGKLPAMTDMSIGNKISSQTEFDTINGLRGLAALLVLLSHTAPGFEDIKLGLSLLFIISGFLLAKPFVLNNNKIFNLNNIEKYLTKRLKRILPMYYFYVFIAFGVSLQLETLARHIVFMQGDGHLWPMTQIFAFYMLLPLVLLICSAAHRIHRIAPIVLLAVACWLSHRYMTDWKPFYNGQFSETFFLYAFLLGVLASYVQHDYLADLHSWLKPRRRYLQALGVFTLLLGVLTILWSAPIQPIPAIWFWLSQFWVKCVLSALLIVLSLNCLNSFYSKIIANWLFRSVGVIGFSFYLLHGFGMEIFSALQAQVLETTSPGERSWLFVVGSFCATYLMALVTYSYIERPFFGYRRKAD